MKVKSIDDWRFVFPFKRKKKWAYKIPVSYYMMDGVGMSLKVVFLKKSER